MGILLRLHALFAEEPTEHSVVMMDQGLPFDVLHARDGEVSSQPPGYTRAAWQDLLSSAVVGFEHATAEHIACLMDQQPLTQTCDSQLTDPTFHEVPLTQHDHHRWKVLQHSLQEAGTLMRSIFDNARKGHTHASLCASIELDQFAVPEVGHATSEEDRHPIRTTPSVPQPARSARCADCAQITDEPLIQDTDTNWYCAECWKTYYSAPADFQLNIAELSVQCNALQQQIQGLQEEAVRANLATQMEDPADHEQYLHSQDSVHTELGGADALTCKK